jgi:hypothetical protein
MKNKIALVLVVVLVLVVGSASAQMTTGTVTGLPTTIAASATSNNLASTTITLRSGSQSQGNGIGVVFIPTVTGGNAANTDNVTFKCNVSFDGSAWTTTLPYNFTVALNGTNAAVGHGSIVPPNVRYIRIDTIVNAATNACTIGTLKYGYWNQ